MKIRLCIQGNVNGHYFFIVGNGRGNPFE